jgi:hypothetical protein
VVLFFSDEGDLPKLRPNFSRIFTTSGSVPGWANTSIHDADPHVEWNAMAAKRLWASGGRAIIEAPG